VRAAQVYIDHASDLKHDSRKACSGVQDEWYRSSELDTQNERGVRIIERYWTGISCLELSMHVFQFCLISCPESISIGDCLFELALSTVKVSSVLSGGRSCRR
jgi:hypothetical protein